uniref:beta strand repeat-containing protein n=1 Tax=Flavobacterium sp. TaxID=239 RepID=UPI00262EC77C
MKLFTLKLLFISLFINQLNAQNLLVNGDFESGGVGVGFNINATGYTFVAAPTGTTGAGDYAIATNPQPYNTTNFISTGDHPTGTGRMMWFDGSSDGGNPSFWKAGNTGGGVCGLVVGATYTFRYWVRSISPNVTGPSTQADIRVVFNNATVTSSPASTLAPLTTAGWEQRVYTFTPTNSCVNIELRNFNTSFVGNDFAIDNLAVLPPPQALGVRFSTVSPLCATPATGSISLYGIGGTAPYTNFAVTGPVSQNNTTGIFPNLPVGTYTVSVTDTAGNTASQSNVTILPALNPLIVSPNTSICSGGNTTLSVNGGTTYTWTASPADPSLTTPTSATPVVSPTATTTYTVSSPANVTRNLIFNGDFSQGNIGFASDYFFVSPTNTSGAQQLYGVVSNPNAWYTSFVNCPDHTNGSGNMMVVDGSVSNSGNNVVWGQAIPVTTNTTYTFSYWAQSLSPNNFATLQVKINGTVLGTAQAPSTIVCGNWTQVTYTWNSGASTTAQISINDTNTAADGNDFALDDIAFTTNVTCNATQSVTVTVSTLSISVPSNQTYCTGANVPVQIFTSSQPGTTFSWTNSNPNLTIGGSGSGNISSFTASNNTTIPQTATITVTGSLSGCADVTSSYTITVNPRPEVMVNNVVKCLGDNSPAVITATPSYPGTYTYTWTVPTGVPPPGNVASFNTTVPGSYSVTITNTISGCSATAPFPGVFSILTDCCTNDFDVTATDQLLCNDTSCSVLNASFLDIKDTTTYTVSSIPFAPENPLGVFPTALCVQDDSYSGVVTMPFQFSFFGQCYNQFQLSTNTYLTFTPNNPNCGGGSPWPFSQPIPNLGAQNAEYLNSIFFPMQDTNPAVPSNPAVQINYIVDGIAPCRKLIVNVRNMPLFSCGTAQGLQESQLVLYEGTNVIDIHVTRRSVCPNWNGGNGVIGILNASGTLGYTPIGRNTGTWPANNESWRFTPSGNSLTTIQWLDGATVIGNTPSLAVCPTSTKTYTAQVRYNICGTVRTVTKPITIEVSPDDTQPAQAIENCLPNNVFNLTTNEPTVLGPLVGTGDYEVYYYTNQSDAENLAVNAIANPSAYVLSSGTSQTIYMSLYNIFTGCIRIRPFNISMVDCSLCPTISNPSATQVLCLGADVNPLSVSTTFTGTNAISFVYFTTPQVGNNMYTGGTLLGNSTPNASNVATYNPGILGTAGSLPNVLGTYYVYAIANPAPSDPTCRPFALIEVNVVSSATILLTSTPATSNQTVCENTPITPITYTFSGATGANVTGLPPGVSFAVSGTTLTISGTPTTTVGSPFNYTVTLTGVGCGNPTATGSITVNPGAFLNLTSAPATANQTICLNQPIIPITYSFGGTASGATVSGLPTGVSFGISGTTLTISGTPTTTTGSPFTFTVSTTGGSCGSPTVTGTITIEPVGTLNLTSAGATANQTVCANSPITSITYTFGGTVTGATVAGLPSGVTAAISGNTVTINGTPTTAVGSPFNYTVSTTGGNCGTPTLTGTITVNPVTTLNLTSAAGTANQTICVNSPITPIVYSFGGSASGIVASGLPAGLIQTVSGNTITISGSPSTITGSPFTITVQTTGGNCGTPSLTATLTVQPQATLVLTSAVATINQTLCVNTPITDIVYTFGGTATGVNVVGLPPGLNVQVVGNVATISGIPTNNAGSPFNYTITTTGGTCGAPSLTGTVTVNIGATLVLSSTPFLANQTVCINEPITNIEYTFGGSATGATVTGLPTGVTASISGNSIIISGTPSVLAGSPYIFNVATSGGTCGAPTLTGTITVQPLATLALTSAPATAAQTVCENGAINAITYTFGGTATGATVAGLPNGVSASVTGNTVTITGAPVSAVGSPYTYTVTTTGGACGFPSLT